MELEKEISVTHKNNPSSDKDNDYWRRSKIISYLDLLPP